MVLLKYYIKRLIREDITKSTFHYGSIKILDFKSCCLASISSTFHYGSIKIYKNKKDPFDEF